MKTLLLSTILLFTVSLNAQNSYPIDGKWTYEASLNTMYIFDNGIRYTYYCIGSNCDSLYQTYQAGDTNAIPGTNPYTFENDTLIVDLGSDNELITPITFECDGGKANFATPGYSLYRLNSNCMTTGVQELNNTPKQLIKIVDILGRETPFKPNTPLLYIYNDGTVERKVVLK